MTNAGLFRGWGGATTSPNLIGHTTPTEIAYSAFRPYGTPEYGAFAARSSSGWREVYPRESIYNLRPSSCPNFKVALARAWQGGAPAHIICIGDSLTSNSQGFTLTYPGILTAMLDADGRYGRVRRGVTPVSTTTALEGTTGNSMGFSSFTSWSWTPSYNVSKFTIYYLTNPPTGGSTFTWALDGGATTTVDTSIGASNGVSSFTVTAGSTDSHTLALAKVGSNAVYVTGAEAWDDSIGYKMKVTGNGVPGASSKRYTITSGTSYTISYQEPEFAVSPDLAIINYGANNISTSIANLKPDLVSTALAASSVGADTILMLPNTFGGSGSNFYFARQAIYEAADATGCPLLDVDRRWQELTSAQRTSIGADAHPAAQGLTDEARLVAQMLYAIA